MTDAGLSINEADRLLRVRADSLRSWEQRYALPTTRRTPGGHRRYLTAVQLRLMRDEIAIGGPTTGGCSACATVEEEVVGHAQVGDLLVGIRVDGRDTIRGSTRGCREEFGLAATLDAVVMPAMREVSTGGDRPLRCRPRTLRHRSSAAGWPS